MKRYLSFLLFFSFLFIISGCNLQAFEPKQMDLRPADYMLETNKLLNSVLVDLQGYMARHLDILRGEYPVETELAALERSINRAKEKIEDFKNVRPPSVYSEHKQRVLTNLVVYKNNLLSYKKALESGAPATIRKAITGLKTQFTTTNGLFVSK